jgi:Rad3-related DNA helicase
MELGKQTTPPLRATEFRKAVLQEYDGETVEECIGAAVDDVWPVATSNEGQPMAKDEHPSPSTAAPEYRAHQREAIVDILSKLYVEDKDVVTLSAPTGAGKSLILYAAMAVIEEVSNRKSFFTTPLNALIDQVDGDDFISDDVITLKGKNNYSCVHPQDRGAPVDKAVCQRVDDFDCEYKDQHHERGGCGYYGRKMVAQTEAEMVTNLSYLMANSMIPDEVDSKFDPRELLVIDECIPKGETVVTTDGRRVEIERFKSEQPLSVDTDTAMLEKDSLVDVRQTTKKDCVRVHATRGSFTASHDHQMKDVDGWKNASNVNRVARPICRMSERAEKEVRASLLGYWFGDGWISSTVGVSGDFVDLERIDGAVESLYGFSHISKRVESGGGSVNPVNGSRHSIDGESNTYNYSRSLGNILQSEGLPSGDKTLQDCSLPDFETDAEVKAFIAGFFGAEGMVPTQATDRSFNVIKASRYTVGGCPFLEQMKDELDSFGIDSYIDVSDGNTRKDGTETVCYELVICSGRKNLNRFLTDIGFEYCRRKEVKSEMVRCYLSEYIDELNQWQRDYEEIIDACERRDWEYGATVDEVTSRGYGDSMKSYIGKRERPKSITKFPSYDEWVEKYVDGDIIYERVENIEHTGKRECYDIEVSDNHNFLVGDEYLAHNCQSIEDFALQFIGVTVSQQTVPVVWDLIPQPPRTEDTERLAQWLTKEVLPPVEDELAELDARGELTEQQVDDQEKLQEFSRKVNNLVADVRDNHWVANREVEDDDWSVEFEPIFIGRFLDRFLWSQGHKIVLSSATIPKGGFLEEVGLGDSDVGRVEVPSTFPRGRRPVYTDEAVGKMTMSQRDRTIPKMARRIGAIADHHWEQEQFRGFVHCHSYSIAARLYESLPRDVRMRTRVQDGDDREASLDAWLDAPVDERGRAEDEGGQVFLSVAMDEGISLDDWRARWQVVAKAAYPYLGPEAKRANYRMDELNDWNWYASKAVVNLQQAVGRGTRSKTDFCLTYILDKSAVQLIEKNEWQFEDWWLDALDVAPADDIPDRY